MLELLLPKFNYKLTKKEGKLFIFDEIRKKYLLLTPEEWVRQHLVHYFVNQKHVPLSLISLEAGKKYNSLKKRCDLIVYKRDGNAWLLAECKAPHILLDENTFLQVSTYYSIIKPEIFVLTNGMELVVYQNDNNGYRKLAEVPEFG